MTPERIRRALAVDVGAVNDDEEVFESSNSLEEATDDESLVC